MGSSSGQSSSYDSSFKILLIGDSGVGKSSLLASFISTYVKDLPPTIGMDIKIKLLTVGDKKLKLTIWDTAGQERYRTLTSSYYRDAHGIILVYDVTRRETFTNLSDFWAKEVDLYSTDQNCVKMLVGNKIDKDSEKAVSREEGMALAKELGCLFLESSAKTRENVERCFQEVALKILESHPSLLEEGSSSEKGNDSEQEPASQPPINVTIDMRTTTGGGCC
ncbi:Ras-related protein RABC2a [Tripterygium wilfordii]|uniref:Ras-related protein RABC2a n=1 Tax=Tripterygium wilfordii TaxID=458696 RepID=A0A7J7DVP6_TRIWF|nr:ras-related protein RABC2a-like [Tripterygium wilfordii]KAF5750435.1 Ras-related protein RABC2a [Tripterygium wilfordii]